MPDVDAHDPREKLVLLARWYARHGIATFPCDDSKRPLTSRGFKDATTDTAVIDRWVNVAHFAMLARPTGDGLLVIDLDVKEGKDGIAEWETLQEVYGEGGTTLVAETASGGVHYYYSLPPGVRCKSMSGQLLLPNGQQATGVDSRSSGGYVIVPGSPGYEWTDVETVEDLEHALHNLAPAPSWLITALAPAAERQEAQPEGPTTASKAMSDLVRLVLSGDNLHDSTRDMVAKLCAHNQSDHDVLQIAQAVMMASKARAGRPDDWQQRFGDLKRLIEGAREKFGYPEDKAEAEHEEEVVEGIELWTQRIDMRAIAYEPIPPVDWLIEDRVQRGRGMVITGLGGSSKTRFTYHLAVGLAIGRLPWNWTVSKTGKSLLVMTEDTLDDVHRTLGGIMSTLSKEDKEKVIENVIPFPLAGNGLKLLSKVGGVMEPTGIAEALEAEIARIGDVAFVAIDPALGITEGDEMDQAHQRALGQYADNLAVRTNACTALLTHAAKSLKTQEEVDSHASRGAGALTDAVRAEFALRTMTKEEAVLAGITDRVERERHVQLMATKANHLPPEAREGLWLFRGAHGVLSQARVELDEAGLDERTRMALDVLKEMCKTHIPTLSEWHDKLCATGVIPPDASQKTTQRIKSELIQAGLIEKGMGHRYQPTREE